MKTTLKIEDILKNKNELVLNNITKKKLLMTFHLDRHSTTDSEPEILSAVQTGNRI